MNEPEPLPVAESHLRVDPFLGTRVHVVAKRQARPNLPSSGCPFCPGGLEAPEPYDVFWFRNRWPAMPGDRCEVVLYTDQHDATFASLGVAGVRKVIDLWADRTAALNSRDDVEFVLVFENCGAEVAATIAHPHGQIYAYDHVPERPAALLASQWHPDADDAERMVGSHGDWQAVVPYASTFPFALNLAPRHRVAHLGELDDAGRDDLAALLVDVLARTHRLFGRAMPYMMWLNQQPSDAAAWPDAWMNIEIVSPWRSAGVARFIAAAEVACGEYFNPVVPETLAAQLHALVPETVR